MFICVTFFIIKINLWKVIKRDDIEMHTEQISARMQQKTNTFLHFEFNVFLL